MTADQSRALGRFNKTKQELDAEKPLNRFMSFCIATLFVALIWKWYLWLWLGLHWSYWTQLLPLAAGLAFVTLFSDKGSITRKLLNTFYSLLFGATLLAQIGGWVGLWTLPIK